MARLLPLVLAVLVCACVRYQRFNWNVSVSSHANGPADPACLTEHVQRADETLSLRGVVVDTLEFIGVNGRFVGRTTVTFVVSTGTALFVQRSDLATLETTLLAAVAWSSKPDGETEDLAERQLRSVFADVVDGCDIELVGRIRSARN